MSSPEMETEADPTILEPKSDNDCEAEETAEEMDAESLEQLEPESQPVTNYAYPPWDYKMTNLTAPPPPTLCTTAPTEFANCILKGCLFAPDGSCLLTNSEDKILRLFNLPVQYYDYVAKANAQNESQNEAVAEADAGEEVDPPLPWIPAVKVKESGQVYDYCWFPLMNSNDPVSSCFLTSAANNPIHLWDAFDGSLRASYLAYNAVDVLVPAHSICFDSLGQRIYCGYEKSIRIFDLSRPGRQSTRRNLKNPTFPELSLHGIISCIAVAPNNSFYACGSYESKKIGLYLEEDGTELCVLQGHKGGLTGLRFSSDGTKLYSGGRKDSQLYAWDLRNMGAEYQIYRRTADTNQRISFDLSPDSKWLVCGGTDGKVKIWDTRAGASDNGEADFEFTGSTDCVNGVSLNPYHPILATSTGQRHFPEINESDDDEDSQIFIESKSKQNFENVVRLFRMD